MRIVVPAGGIGAARFLRGLRLAAPDAEVTVVGNTGDDITLFGLRVCPDLDTVMYTLGGGIDEEKGWGRDGETFAVLDELRAHGAEPTWFGLGDRDIATHLIRTQMLDAGYPLSAVTAALCERWRPGVTLLPMSDDRVETHVVVSLPETEADTRDGRGTRAIHFQEYWVRYRAEPPVARVLAVGADRSTPAPGVLDAIATADVVLLPPSNPVVSIGAVLAVPGLRAALTAAAAPVVGVSPIIGGAPVRGMADRLLPAVGVPVTADGVARHYGARTAAARAAGGLLDGWLVDDADADAVAGLVADGIATRSRPLLMSSPEAAAEIAGAALDLAAEVANARVAP